MWDDSIADPNWTRKLPFSNNVFTYIKIKKSPLKGMMIKGGVSLITRGYGQTVSLEPYMFAEDPDYPDQLVSPLSPMARSEVVNETDNVVYLPSLALLTFIIDIELFGPMKMLQYISLSDHQGYI